MHQSSWHIRSWLILPLRVCVPKLKFYSPGFEVCGNCGAPFGSGLQCLSAFTPQHVLKVSAKIYVNWKKQLMSYGQLTYKPCPFKVFFLFLFMVTVFFNWSCSFIVPMCIAVPHGCIKNLVSIESKLRKVY